MNCVDYGIIRERLLIHDVLQGNSDSTKDLEAEFQEVLLQKPSWSITGASTLQQNQLSCRLSEARLPDSDFECIRQELADAGVLPEMDTLDLVRSGGFGIARVNERF
jgi:hypothetical protein